MFFLVDNVDWYTGNDKTRVLVCSIHNHQAVVRIIRYVNYGNSSLSLLLLHAGAQIQ